MSTRHGACAPTRHRTISWGPWAAGATFETRKGDLRGSTPCLSDTPGLDRGREPDWLDSGVWVSVTVGCSLLPRGDRVSWAEAPHREAPI